jgi:transposase
MAEERKKYSREFKITAVELSLARGQVKEVAEELGIDSQLLSTWKYQFRNDKDIAFPGNGKKKRTPLEEENTMLRKELADAKLERDILKKAISIFSSSDRKNMRS